MLIAGIFFATVEMVQQLISNALYNYYSFNPKLGPSPCSKEHIQAWGNHT